LTGEAGQPVIVGLGMTDMSKRVYGKTAAQFAAEAVHAAAADAGMRVSDIGGLFTHAGISGTPGLPLAFELGMQNLSLQSEIQSFGASACAMVQYAYMAINAGMVDSVVCVFGDAALSPNVGIGGSFYGGAGRSMVGFDGLLASSGWATPVNGYALAASRHMKRYGTTSEEFGAVAVAARTWAGLNPLAQLRDPITIEDHQSSRIIAEPFHLLDCCLVSNGAIAVIVASAEVASTLRQAPVHIHGWAQAHAGYPMERDSEFGLVSGAAISGPAALKMAGLTVADVDVVELYDCFTFVTLITLEDYGFCDKGEGGAFVASGALGPGGTCPTNTGGGQLSSYYMQGMTPLSEAIIQARGQAGERQVEKHDVMMVSGNGGKLQFHATLILSPYPKT
jgi:acetyl-CoA acetyltransferase